MKAIIKKDNNIYISEILAIKNDKFKSQCIAFNSDFTKIEVVDIWTTSNKITRNVFIIEWQDFLHKFNEWQGQEFLVKNIDLMNKFLDKKQLDITNHPQFTPLAQNNSLPDWFEIESDNDVKSLLESAYKFHDSVVIENKSLEDNSLLIKFDTTWGCYITLKLHDVKINEALELNQVILNADIKIADESIYVSFDNNQIICSKLNWQIELY